MTGMSHLRLPPFLACAMSLAMAGCLGSSRPARFYTLEPVQVRDGPDSSATDATLAVGPVELPDYVDRPQIVTRTGANELVISEVDRWGRSLDNQISNSLVTTLRDRLDSEQITVVPWGSALLSGGSSYRVKVRVSRFDGILGQSVVLQARWELCVRSGGGKEESLGGKEASLTGPIHGPPYDALAAALPPALVPPRPQMPHCLAVPQVAR